MLFMGKSTIKVASTDLPRRGRLRQPIRGDGASAPSSAPLLRHEKDSAK